MMKSIGLRIANRRWILCLLAALCWMPLHAAPAEPAALPAKKSVRIYLLMGQSNMAGRDTRQLATQVDQPRIIALAADGRWVVARDPIHPKIGRIEPGAGPGIPFAREMLKAFPDATIALVPCAVGGSPLKRWVKGGDLYTRAVQQAKAAAADGILSGVLWHQGETDTTDEKNAETYEARLTRMITDLRADLGTPDLPVVVGQLGDFLNRNPQKHPFVETVRTALRKLPTIVPHTGYADSAGLADQGDQLHFNADAQNELGKRYAAAMQGL